MDLAKQEENKQKILKGIEGYKKEQEEILQAIKDHDNALNQDDFDKTFGSIPASRVRIWPYERDSFILGGLHGNDLDKWLHLTQFMMRVGKIQAVKSDSGKVVYSVPESEKEPK